MLLVILAALSLAIWVYLLAFRARFWRMRPDASLHILHAGAPSVDAVIPARNEAGVVARAMSSLTAQNYPGDFRITLVDDASDDDTAQLAAAAAPGAQVISARPLPAGWTGKMWAVSEGVA